MEERKGLVYGMGLWIGEGLRDRLYGQPIQPQENVDVVPQKMGKPWRGYLGLLILLERKWWFPACE